MNIQEISGDRPLSRKHQISYILVFFPRAKGLFVPLKTQVFCPSTVPPGDASPFRKYVDAFLSEMIPLLVTPRTIDVFDIGCGSGYVRRILERQGYRGTYTGLDVVEDRFDRFSTPVFSSQLIASRIESFVPTQTYDLVISNTSLEHVDNDTIAVTKAHQLAGAHGVELHVVPSWWSFFLYLWHGYRHYTPGSLKRLFEGSDYTIYRLGGLFSFFGQFFLVTIPERYMKLSFRTKIWYPRVAGWIIWLDRFLPFFPMGYAVVVRHGKSKNN